MSSWWVETQVYDLRTPTMLAAGPSNSSKLASESYLVRLFTVISFDRSIPAQSKLPINKFSVR